MIVVTKLSTGSFVCMGGIWTSLDALRKFLKESWGTDEVFLRDADVRTNAFWVYEAEKLANRHMMR